LYCSFNLHFITICPDHNYFFLSSNFEFSLFCLSKALRYMTILFSISDFFFIVVLGAVTLWHLPDFLKCR
jgi:hypothetical protein